ncbi:MAG: sigma-E factor regulatory protein RseB domain-containing protein [Candidatus Cybelea sp.]
MKRASAVAALALMVGALGPASAQSNANPSTSLRTSPIDALILAAITAPSTVSYTGTVQSFRIGNGASEAAVYRVEHRAPDLTLRVYTAPSDLSGYSVVLKGDQSYAIDSKKRRIVESRDDAVDARMALLSDDALMHKNYRAVVRGSEIFDRRRAIDVAILSKDTSRAAMLLRIDDATKIVLDKQEFGPEGALVSELRFENIDFASSIPAADFAIPKGYGVVRGPTFGETFDRPDRVVHAAGFATREPRSLPGGFVPIEGDLDDMQGVRTVHFLYCDGIRTVSLFESAQASTLEVTQLRPRSLRVGRRDAEYAEDGTTALLAWSDGSLYYTLVGEVGLVDLPPLAASITP